MRKLLLVLATMMLMACGRVPMTGQAIQAGAEPAAITAPHAFTPTDVLSPPPSGTTPRLSWQQAFDALNKKAAISNSPISADEVYLGVFDHSDGGPANKLVWAFVFFDQPLPYEAQPLNQPRAAVTTPSHQDVLVVIDASNGSHIVTIYGVHR